jgi:C-terminal processing protease CtpA/Prc
MIKKFIFAGVLFLAMTASISCEDTNNFVEENPDGNVEVKLNDPINDFIWKGLNSWYNWQSESVDLADTKDDVADDYHTFLNGYNDYRDLMYNLCYKHHSIVGSQNAIDRYSWFIEDYEVQNQAFQGIRTRFGFTSKMINLNDGSNKVVILVAMVEPNSPAGEAQMKRGDLISGINGTVLNTSNYSSTYTQLSNETVTFSFVDEQDGEFIQLEDKTMTRALVAANPIHFTKVFDNIGGKKVGYLVYNQFSGSYNDELNEAFAEFKAAGVEEFVLDLRFNGGGSVLTSALLASMIYDAAGTGVFAELKFNGKHRNSDDFYNFENRNYLFSTEGQSEGREPLNRLNTVNRLYVLTSGGTASASEMVINGLRPYMSSVKLIGSTTYGKNVGSITLYDAPKNDYVGESRANPAHKYAMQPIVFQIYNKNRESDYIQGFAPDIEVNEYNYWNDLLPFGDRNEALLKAALDDIGGVVSKQELSKAQKQAKLIKITLPEERFDNEMYVDPDFDRREY